MPLHHPPLLEKNSSSSFLHLHSHHNRNSSYHIAEGSRVHLYTLQSHLPLDHHAAFSNENLAGRPSNAERDPNFWEEVEGAAIGIDRRLFVEAPEEHQPFIEACDWVSAEIRAIEDIHTN
ncbi:hypothetical protein Tco_1568900 [Tanacetum coccineum]